MASNDPRCVALRKASAERRAVREQEKQELATKKAEARLLKAVTTDEQRAERRKAQAKEYYRRVRPPLSGLTVVGRQLKQLRADEPGDLSSTYHHEVWENKLWHLERRYRFLLEDRKAERAKVARSKELRWLDLCVFTAAQRLAETVAVLGAKSAQAGLAEKTLRDCKHRLKLFKQGPQLTQEESAMRMDEAERKLARKKKRDRRKLEDAQRRSKEAEQRLRAMKESGE